MVNLNSKIKSAIRRRIIMHSGGRHLILHEGKLAKEFGVSRTPIRQVIQSLAAEWLVEVRSGVGTIATPIQADRRQSDFRAFATILRSCAECANDEQVKQVTVELSVNRIFLEEHKSEVDSDLFFEGSSKFLASLCELLDDPIFRDALVACYWRFVRRRIAEYGGDFSSAVDDLIATLKDAEYGAKNRAADNVFRMIAARVDQMSPEPGA